MQRRSTTEVFLSDGTVGTIETWKHEGGDDTQALVRFGEGARLWVAASSLVARPDGGYMLPLSRAQLDGGPTIIPVMAEVATVTKRVKSAGTVRVRKVVREREETVNATVTREVVRVDRVPVNRVVDGPAAPRQEGDVLIIPVFEEVLVVEKRLMLKEEIRVTRQRVSEASAPQRVMLRAEEIVVERDDEPARPETDVSH